MGAHKRIRDRTFELHRAIVEEFRRLHPADDAERVLWHELLRAATSISTNSAESDGAQSRREFIVKFPITLKEAREALQLLRLLQSICPNRDRQLGALLEQCDRITAILVASLRTAKRRDSTPTPRRP